MYKTNKDLGILTEIIESLKMDVRGFPVALSDKSGRIVYLNNLAEKLEKESQESILPDYTDSMETKGITVNKEIKFTDEYGGGSKFYFIDVFTLYDGLGRHAGSLYTFYDLMEAVKNISMTTDIIPKTQSKLEIESFFISELEFLKRLKEEMSRSFRYKIPIAITAFNFSNLKRITDLTENMPGFLEKYETVFKASFRLFDFFYRADTNLFIVAMPHATKKDAINKLNMFNKALKGEHSIGMPISEIESLRNFQNVEHQIIFRSVEFNPQRHRPDIHGTDLFIRDAVGALRENPDNEII